MTNNGSQVPSCPQDFELPAKQRLDAFMWMYYNLGVNKGQTLKDSSDAFKRYRLKPRVLRSISSPSMAISVLGSQINFPICISPTAMHAFAHIEKEIATARAASSEGTLMVLSSSANTSPKDILPAAPDGLFWMQTYMFKSKDLTISVVRNAERAGFKALVVTVDSARMGNQPVYAYGIEKKYRGCQEYLLCNYDNDSEEVKKQGPSNLWQYATDQINGSNSSLKEIKWLRSQTKLPIVLKGILNPSVAKLAVSEGVADGIIVSAHGGRQLDGVPAPIDALSDIVEAVRGSGVEVYMDGGVRTGTDVLKALALGARAVFIGRPVLYGLAAQGQQGVCHVLQLLKEELRLAMVLSGCASLQDVKPSLVIHESTYLMSAL